MSFKSYAAKLRWSFLSKDPRFRFLDSDLDEADGDITEVLPACDAEPQSVLTRYGVVQVGISELSLRGEW